MLAHTKLTAVVLSLALAGATTLTSQLALAEEAGTTHNHMSMPGMSAAEHEQMMKDNEGNTEHDHSKMQEIDPHAAHRHMLHDSEGTKKVKRTTVEYTIPLIKLVRADGKTVDLAQELDDGRPVVLNFIYTTCTEICPVTTSTFEKFQGKLGKGRNKVHMVTISIDPEQDTPAVLTKFAKRYKAGSSWNFYTGTVDASVEAQKTFQAYNGDKMNHVPTTYLRAAPSKPWLRIDGFVSPDELIHDYKVLMSGK